MDNYSRFSFYFHSLDFCYDKVSLEEITECLKTFKKSIGDWKEVECVLVDLLGFIDSQLCDVYTETIRSRFVSIVRLCENVATFNLSLLKARLSTDILKSLNLLQSSNKKSGKSKSVYPMIKFNLMHEMNQGYSILIVELVTWSSPPIEMITTIWSLIGYFDLDPNRVIDLILDVLELRLDKSTQFIELLNLLNADRQDMADLIGHKLVGNTSDSIYELIVTLVRNDVIDLAAIYEHLSPSNESIKDCYDKDMDNARNKKFVNSKLKDDPSVVVTEEVEEVKIEEKDYSDNQKIRLCFYFLKDGHWQIVKNLMNLLPPYFALRYPPLCKELCKILHEVIEPLYSRCCSLPAVLKSHRPTKFTPLVGSFEYIDSYNDFNKAVFDITNYLGPMVSTDHILFSKLVRITQSYFYEHKNKSKESNTVIDATYQGFFNLIRNCLLPSLSMLNGDVSLAEEIWDAVKHLPYDIRYSLYIYWRDISSDDHPDLIEEKRSVQSQIKYIMKRLSKENVKQMGRQLGKLCHCNPGIVLVEIMFPIFLFSSQSIPVVHLFRYLSGLSLDMLVFSIIDILSTKFEVLEVTTAGHSIEVVSTFVVLLCKRYSVDLTGLFQFILDMIKDGHYIYLNIINEIIHKLGVINMSEDVTDYPVETISLGNIPSPSNEWIEGSTILKDALIENNLSISYIIILSQEKHLQVHRSSGDSVEVISRLYDQYHDTMLKMSSFVLRNWSEDDLIRSCPSITQLFTSYKLEPDIAFHLGRSIFSSTVQNKYRSAIIGSNDQSHSEKNASLTNEELFSKIREEITADILQSVVLYFSHKNWTRLNFYFYITFWLLQTSDLIVLTVAQQRNLATLFIKLEQVNVERTISQEHSTEELGEEIIQRQSHVNMIDHWLNSIKENLIPMICSVNFSSEFAERFIEYCIFPRVCFSSNDAFFVSQFILKLHTMKTSYFSILTCLDQIFNGITLVISTCTEKEAQRYSLFINELLNIAMRWYSSEEIYNNECFKYPGSIYAFNSLQCGMRDFVMEHLSYSKYRYLVLKWHFSLSKSIFSCLESDKIGQIRNSLVLLTKIVNNYPKTKQDGYPIKHSIMKLKEKKYPNNSDFKALLDNCYKVLNGKMSSWIELSAFYKAKKQMRKILITVDGSMDSDPSESYVKRKKLEDSESIDYSVSHIILEDDDGSMNIQNI